MPDRVANATTSYRSRRQAEIANDAGLRKHLCHHVIARSAGSQGVTCQSAVGVFAAEGRARFPTRSIYYHGGVRSVDVAVVGAGVFGSWTALWLRRAGRSVLLLDAWAPGHGRSSSGGESRVIRVGYGPDRLYSEMAARSRHHWIELFGADAPLFFYKTGVLRICRKDDEYFKATCRTLATSNAEFEILDAVDLGKRYPQIAVTEKDVCAMLEPEGGAIAARRAVMAVVNAAVRSGAAFMVEEGRIHPQQKGLQAALKIKSGEVIEVDQLVFACGPWLPKLFPEVLGRRIFVTRQEVLFFSRPAGDSAFKKERFPVWIDYTDWRIPYGFPDLDSRGMKIAFDRHGPLFDPDFDDRLVTPSTVEEARSYLAQRFPALGNVQAGRDTRLSVRKHFER